MLPSLPRRKKKEGRGERMSFTAVLIYLLVAGMNLSVDDVLSIHAENVYVPCGSNSKHFGVDGRSPCYDCYGFSMDLVRILAVKNVTAVPVVVRRPGGRHMVVAYRGDGWVFVEPQTGGSVDSRYEFWGVDVDDFGLRKEVEAAWKAKREEAEALYAYFG